MESSSKIKKQSALSRLFSYAGKYKHLSVGACVLSSISKILAFVPFVYTWLIIKEVLEVAPNYADEGCSLRELIKNNKSK